MSDQADERARRVEEILSAHGLFPGTGDESFRDVFKKAIDDLRYEEQRPARVEASLTRIETLLEAILVAVRDK